MNKALVFLVTFALFSIILGYQFFNWTINRVYVEEGNSLMLQYKGPLLLGRGIQPETGSWAKEGEMGVLAKLRGPGRHFYCPIWWTRTIVPDVVIKPNEVGVVTCKLGKDLPNGEFLVDGDIGNTEYKGILRKVLHPGRYRVNTYGYDIEVVNTQKFQSGNQTKFAGWVEIPTGYVGVVTNLADNPARGFTKGIQNNVLPPGIYPINAREQNIDVVEIGYRHSTIQMDVKRDADGLIVVDERGEPLVDDANSGIEFPSSDGFPMHIDFTAIWGILPNQAAHAIRTIGNVEMVEQKIVLPQIESICRNNGSEYKAVELLVGVEREKFQSKTLDEFHEVLGSKQISVLYGLVKHVYVPAAVREPIQQSFIADELKLTRSQEQLTAKEEASFRESENKVSLASRTVDVDTTKLVATKLAAGTREAEGIRAATQQLVAAIAKETAELDSQAEIIIGEATQKGVQLQEEAKSNRFKLAVDAFGSPEAYNNWIFATGLPENIDLKLLYAGEGTFWTDLKNVPLTIPVEKK